MSAVEDLCGWTPDYFLANQLDCQRILNESDKRKSVPSLNSLPLHMFRDKQLVRFKGMIQDMYNPEYYFDSFQISNVKTNETTTCYGKYRDVFDAVDETVVVDSEDNVSAERQVCFVISVPCLNTWAKEKYEKIEKISRTSSNSATKRSLDSEQMDCEESSNKKPVQHISNQEQSSSGLLSKEYILNFPVPDEDSKACIVKIYDKTLYKLNQVIDIIGFLSLDPSLSLTHDSNNLMDNAEFESHNPPASLVPRLHAIDIKDTLEEEISNVAINCTTFTENPRAELKFILSQVLFGDILAAEYLICHLISSVYMRRDLLSLGTFPLNITNFPLDKCKTFPEDFYKILALFIPKSHLLTISLDDLNNLNLLPKKDYDCNRLTSGILQLSDNTHLVLDETKLTSGKVSANGRRNYEAISSLINYQKVTYDFKYYTIDFETDIPVLIFSETKSMIPCDKEIALKKNPESENLYSEIFEATRQYIRDETRTTNIRNYLSISRRRNIEIEENIVEVIQEDFVKMRQLDKSTTADDLHSLMVLARLISLSYGEEKLTIERWKQALQMEKERKVRLQSRGK